MKQLLKKWPRLRLLLARVYYSVWRILETQVLGTRIQESIWRNRIDYKRNDLAKELCESSRHPHRKLLAERISSHAPLQSVLEVGCGLGPNLYLLATKFPGAKLHGVDINHEAVDDGKKLFQEMGIDNVLLSVGKADELGSFEDKSIDVVFTDATIMYVGPDKIYRVVEEFVRIAKKAVVLNEWHIDAEDPGHARRHRYLNGHWMHDYTHVISQFVLAHKIKKSKMPRDLWDDSVWQKFGYVIEARLD